ncbi:AAA family ATPase [Mesorhizobium newzealandense]|uniref:AAA family ATPase n=1 Tax=Mesorhizobium newzealandense TaxID=1300302 RepID=A0ABW4UIH9_9HYPH
MSGPDDADLVNMAAKITLPRAELELLFDELSSKHGGRTFKISALFSPAESPYLGAFKSARDGGWFEELLERLLLSDAFRGDEATAPADEWQVRLQGMVQPALGAEPVGASTTGFMNAARRVCLVEVLTNPKAGGTGFLVGPQAVLTARHVIENLVDGNGQRTNGSADLIRVVFGAVGRYYNRRSECGVTTDWLIEASQCHDSEKLGNVFSAIAEADPESFRDRLDFAILRLDRPVGRERGFYRLDKKRVPCVQATGAEITLFQHPYGGEMYRTHGQGIELWPKSVETRLRHNANATDGSSGGLILDKTFEPVAMHQCTFRDKNGVATINGAIPTACIAARMGAEAIEQVIGLDPIWQIEATGEPVVGRQGFQESVMRALSGQARIIAVRGGPDCGKSFSASILRAMLADGGNLVITMSASTIPLDAKSFARQLLELTHCPPSALPAEEPDTAREAWERDLLLPALMKQLSNYVGNRLLWLVIDDLDTNPIAAGSTTSLLERLYSDILAYPYLRLVLIGMRGQIPAAKPLQTVYDDVNVVTESEVEDYLNRKDIAAGCARSPETVHELAESIVALARTNLRPITDSYSRGIDYNRKQAGSGRMNHSLPQFSSNPAKALWTQVRERAAMVGAFDPLKLVGKPDGMELEVLTALGNECVEVLTSSLPHWQLNPDSRRRILAALMRSGRLEAMARAADPKDDFGRYLVDAVLGELRIPNAASLTELDVIHRAAQFAATVNGGQDAIAAIDRAVARRETKEAIEWLLPHGLIGRDHQLRKLRSFIERPIEAALPFIFVSGTGGVGKSALMAEFIRRTERDYGDGLPIIRFDFDRAVLAEANPTTLMREFSRQLALAVPSISAPLNSFCAQLDQRFDFALDTESIDFTSHSARESTNWSLWRGLGLADELANQPVVLVIDTIEEILVHHDGRGTAVVDWLRSLMTDGGAVHLRAILCGRSEDQFEELAETFSAEHIRLGDLGPVSALRLLKAYLSDATFTLSESEGRELVSYYGANPMTLKILARYLLVEGKGGAKALLGKKGQRRFTAQVAQQYLYTRILGRIRTEDGDLVRVAHPGLVLRRVTPSLLRHVLAEPCGLGPIDDRRALQLFDALALQIWLVEPTADASAVRHRRDLRRLIFASMNETEREKTQRIHRSASQYYAKHLDAHLTPVEQDREALYHRLFVDPKLKLTDSALLEFASALGKDSADLPIAFRARLRQLDGRALRRDELAALDGKVRLQIEERRDRDRLKRLGATSSGLSASPPASQRSQSIEVESAYAEGDLAAVVSIRGSVFDAFVEDILFGDRTAGHMPADLTDLPIWRVAMSILGQPEKRSFARLVVSRFEEIDRRVEWDRPLNPNRKQSISVGRAVKALVRLLGGNPLFLATEDRGGFPDVEHLETTEALRARQLLRDDEPTRRSLRIPLILMRYMSDGFLDIGSAPSNPDIFRLDPIARDAISSIYKGSHSLRPSLIDIARPEGRQAALQVTAKSFVDASSAVHLRGVSPELYPPIQALLQPEHVLEFVAVMEESLSVWPRELTRVQLSASLRQNPRRWTATVLDMADRFGKLSNLVDRMVRVPRPGGAELSVAAMVRRYTRRLLPSK